MPLASASSILSPASLPPQMPYGKFFGFMPSSRHSSFLGQALHRIIALDVSSANASYQLWQSSGNPASKVLALFTPLRAPSRARVPALHTAVVRAPVVPFPIPVVALLASHLQPVATYLAAPCSAARRPRACPSRPGIGYRVHERFC